MSGVYRTPIYNALEDVYPYFRFLKLRPYYDWEIFRRNVLGSRHKRDRTYMF